MDFVSVNNEIITFYQTKPTFDTHQRYESLRTETSNFLEHFFWSGFSLVLIIDANWPKCLDKNYLNWTRNRETFVIGKGRFSILKMLKNNCLFSLTSSLFLVWNVEYSNICVFFSFSAESKKFTNQMWLKSIWSRRNGWMARFRALYNEFI